MVKVNKIDSNVTGLRIAEETSLKTLPGSPVWEALEPNSYNDFGGTVTTLARNPISADRQRKKGVVTDLDAAGGFNTDLTQTNLQNILQGFFFADLRRKGEQVPTAVTATKYNIASTSGFAVDSLVFGKGFTESANNGLKTITAVTADTSVTVSGLASESSPTGEITVVGHKFQAAEVDIVGGKLTRASGTKDFTSLGLTPGEWVFIGGDAAGEEFTTVANNGFKRIIEVTETTIVFDKSGSALVDETGTGLTIAVFFGRVLKNETGSLIKRRTYQLERTLGAIDNSAPTDLQAEYLTGSVPNELTINVTSADKVNCDLTFMAADHEVRTSTDGVKTGTRPTLEEADAFNTSSDFSRIKLAKVIDGNIAPEPLFAFVSEMTINLTNNVSANKAIGTLGAFDLTAGTFQVGGEMTAMFSDIEALAAVRNNEDITLDMAIVKNNVGVVIDFPLITLSDGKATVEQDTPITLPLTNEAASGISINENLNHTMLMNFFDYLPTAAQ